MDVNLSNITPEWLAKNFRTLMNRVREKYNRRFGTGKPQKSGELICCNRCGDLHPISDLHYRFSVNHPIHGLLNLWYCDKCYKQVRK